MSVEALPRDVLLTVLRGLPCKDIIRLSTTCQSIRAAIIIHTTSLLQETMGKPRSGAFASLTSGRALATHMRTLQQREVRGQRELDLLGPSGLIDFGLRIKALGARIAQKTTGIYVHIDDWMLSQCTLDNLPHDKNDRKRLADRLCASPFVVAAVRCKTMPVNKIAHLTRSLQYSGTLAGVSITEGVKRRARHV